MTISVFTGSHYFLSNFFIRPFSYTLPFCVPSFSTQVASGEHAFQASKTAEAESACEILDAATPNAAKRLGRSVTLVQNWNDLRLEVMRKVLVAKFSGPEMAYLLLNTGTHELIEGNSWHDNFWGSCYCSRCQKIAGQNHLGKLLMELRETLEIP